MADRSGLMIRGMSAQIEVVAEPTSEHREAIAHPLREYNRRHGPPLTAKPVGILLKDETGTSVGGLWGRIAYDWLFIELLAVPENLRGKNHGAALVAEAEEIARREGCLGVWLDTYEFQSRGFYERLGYSVFGALDDHPAGSARFFMKKRL